MTETVTPYGDKPKINRGIPGPKPLSFGALEYAVEQLHHRHLHERPKFTLRVARADCTQASALVDAIERLTRDNPLSARIKVVVDPHLVDGNWYIESDLGRMGSVDP